MLHKKSLDRAESWAHRSTMPTDVSVPSLLEVLSSPEHLASSCLTPPRAGGRGEEGTLIVVTQS